MAYTNGFDSVAVLSALADRVGFRQPVGTGAPTLSTAVTTANSGRYFQDFHSLVTVENIKATMPTPAATDAQLITYLTDLRKAAIMRAMNGVFNDDTMLEQVRVFTRIGLNDQLAPNNGKFVGYEINVADKPDAAVQIDALFLYLNEAATFNVYCFKDGKQAAEWTKEVTTVADEITEATLDGKVLGRGRWYIGYFQDDLGSAQAYIEQPDCFADTKLFGIDALMCDATGATTFDREQRSYTALPYGLNMDISSFKDQTTPIKRKAAMLDQLIGLTMAYMVLEQIVYAVRSNSTERILRDQISQIGMNLDLNGTAPISDSPQVQGLKQRIDRETHNVRENFYPEKSSVIVSRC